MFMDVDRAGQSGWRGHRGTFGAHAIPHRAGARHAGRGAVSRRWRQRRPSICPSVAAFRWSSSQD